MPEISDRELNIWIDDVHNALTCLESIRESMDDLFLDQHLYWNLEEAERILTDLAGDMDATLELSHIGYQDRQEIRVYQVLGYDPDNPIIQQIISEHRDRERVQSYSKKDGVGPEHVHQIGYTQSEEEEGTIGGFKIKRKLEVSP